ncbi:isochorismate synthase [Adlercreutzia sp. R21]|uniref:isochorismate synthase n=1 Tax=Adlercreutzia wanghongyangiae TaxID=3111451 RepID=UPI002DB6A254|nr:isochorismate synthase [Adlercreutzia sp. R21]MEC4184863.1 isochorismate synthase [Adlercreutzia sp. R21]
MTRIYTCNVPIEADLVDAFCWLQKGFTDQFVYYDKARACRYMGLGRCIALPSLRDVEYECGEGSPLREVAAGEAAGGVPACGDVAGGACGTAAGATEGHMPADEQPPVFFSFNRFDATNPAPADELMASFPHLRFMLPEIVLIENERGRFLQVNSLGPVYPGRVARFQRMVAAAPARASEIIPFTLQPDSRAAWDAEMEAALDAIDAGRVQKVVLSRRQRLVAERPFSSKDLLVNLIDGDARGTVLLYRYADVFFCGCTPELLVRKQGGAVESMCLAGTCPVGATPEESAALADELMADSKNRAEHDYVVQLIRGVLDRVCYDVDVPATPQIMTLSHVQHLFTPARARVLAGITLADLMEDLHPTPAVAGTPVGEAKMLLRVIEPYNRGFFAGACGFVDGDGDGEFSVALRTGVFDGESGWVYAGCGIVAGSDATAEYEEINLKLRTILSAFGA